MTRLPVNQKTDEELMEDYRLGDFRAFEELYQRHAPRVYGFLRRKVGDSDAHDLFQTVFTKLHTHRRKYDRTFPFLPWLFTIANHAVIDYLRRLQSQRATEIAVAQEPLYPSGQPAPALAALSEGTKAALSSREQEVISLRFDSDLSFAEIARRLNLEAPNVRKISSRALTKIQRLLSRKKEADL